MTTRPDLDHRPPPPDPGPATRIRTRTGFGTRVAASAMVLAAPVAAWRVVGPNPGNEYRNDPSIPADHWDHLMRPPAWDPGLERAIGWGGVVVFGLAALVVLTSWYRGRLDRVWTVPLVVVTAVGLGAGVAQRVLTAAVIGANIGGGFVLLFGGPTAVFLLAAAATRAVVVVRTTDVVDRR